MKFQIKKRFSDEILIEGEAESFAKFIEENKSDLSGSNLSGSDLSGSNLSGSDLSDSNLSGSNLSGSDLRGSNLSGSNLSGSDLRGSNLSGSDLSGSNLRRIKITLLQKEFIVKALDIDIIDIENGENKNTKL